MGAVNAVDAVGFFKMKKLATYYVNVYVNFGIRPRYSPSPAESCDLHPNRKTKRRVTSSAAFDVCDFTPDVLTQSLVGSIGEVWCVHTNIRHPFISHANWKFPQIPHRQFRRLIRKIWALLFSYELILSKDRHRTQPVSCPVPQLWFGPQWCQTVKLF